MQLSRIRATVVMTSLVFLSVLILGQSGPCEGPPDWDGYDWTLRLERLRIENPEEGRKADCPGDPAKESNDEPYFAMLGFRSRLFIPNSTEVRLVFHENDEWGEDRAEAAIPQQMGTLYFTDVHLMDCDELASIPTGLELIGAVAIAIESDGSPFGYIRDGLNAARDELQTQLDQLWGQGALITSGSPTAQQFRATADAVSQAARDELTTFDHLLFSGFDPDDLIGFHIFAFLGIQGRAQTDCPNVPAVRFAFNNTRPGINRNWSDCLALPSLPTITEGVLTVHLDWTLPPGYPGFNPILILHNDNEKHGLVKYWVEASLRTSSNLPGAYHDCNICGH